MIIDKMIAALWNMGAVYIWRNSSGFRERNFKDNSDYG